VADQSYPYIEHIVVDGASKDHTMEVVQTFPYVAHAISEPDKGIYDAMNKGIAKATGDIVGILNADDYYPHPNILQQVADVFAEENYDAVFGDVLFIDPQKPKKVTRRYRSGSFTPTRIGYGWMPAHPALFFRKHIYDRYGLYKTDYQIAGDYEYVARVFKNHQLHYTHYDEPLVMMRQGGTSNAGLKSTIVLNQEVMRACRENNIDTNWFKLLSKYPRKCFELFFLS